MKNFSDKNKIIIFGYLGYQSKKIDGQTVKTRMVYELLKNKLGKDVVSYIDSESLNTLKAWIYFFQILFRASYIIYLPGQNNLKYFSPLLFLGKFLFHYEIIYIVVGGWLSSFLSKHKAYRLVVRKMKIILVESLTLSKDLASIHRLNNTRFFPNFRIHHFIWQKHSSIKNKLRIVFMARVMKEKGVDTLLYLALFFKKNNLNITIDIYGPIQREYEQYFTNEMHNSELIYYKGIVSSDKVYLTLSKYDLLLLPTYYEGEGFPGTILDAYISGIPVIASKWKYIPEYVDHGRTGYTYNLNNNQQLIEYILSLYYDPVELDLMKKNAHQKSQEYSSEIAWEILKTYIVNKSK